MGIVEHSQRIENLTYSDLPHTYIYSALACCLAGGRTLDSRLAVATVEAAHTPQHEPGSRCGADYLCAKTAAYAGDSGGFAGLWHGYWDLGVSKETDLGFLAARHRVRGLGSLGRT